MQHSVFHLKYSSGYFAGLLAPGTGENPVLLNSVHTSSRLESTSALAALEHNTHMHGI